MTEDEILEKLVDYVERSVGLEYPVDSDQYKGIAFKDFRLAWEEGYVESGNPLLTADALTGIIRERKDGAWWSRYGKNWDLFCMLWHEWCWFAEQWEVDR